MECIAYWQKGGLLIMGWAYRPRCGRLRGYRAKNNNNNTIPRQIFYLALADFDMIFKKIMSFHAALSWTGKKSPTTGYDVLAVTEKTPCVPHVVCSEHVGGITLQPGSYDVMCTVSGTSSGPTSALFIFLGEEQSEPLCRSEPAAGPGMTHVTYTVQTTAIITRPNHILSVQTNCMKNITKREITITPQHAQWTRRVSVGLEEKISAMEGDTAAAILTAMDSTEKRLRALESRLEFRVDAKAKHLLDEVAAVTDAIRQMEQWRADTTAKENAALKIELKHLMEAHRRDIATLRSDISRHDVVSRSQQEGLEIQRDEAHSAVAVLRGEVIQQQREMDAMREDIAVMMAALRQNAAAHGTHHHI